MNIIKILLEDLQSTLDLENLEKLEKILRKEAGYKNKFLNLKYNELGADKYIEWLKSEVNKVQKRQKEHGLEQSKIDDIDLLPAEQLPQDLEYKKEPKIKDEAIIDVLSSLPRLISSPKAKKSREDKNITLTKTAKGGVLFSDKDLIRAVAARMGIDADIYEAAGFGRLPDNYNDEDVWKTMDASKNGTIPFVPSKWQILYTDAIQAISALPKDIKDEISNILEKGSSPKDVHYPVKSDLPYDDTGTTYESIKLLDDIILEDNNGICIIPKYSIISKIR